MSAIKNSEAVAALSHLFGTDEGVIRHCYNESQLSEWWSSKRADLLAQILEGWKLQSLEEASPVADRARKLFPELDRCGIGIRQEDGGSGSFYVNIHPFLLETLQVFHPIDLPSITSHLEFTPPADLVRYLRDTRQFAKESAADPMRFANLIASVFGATQSAMILTLGEFAIKQKNGPQSRRVESFEKLFKFTCDSQKWSESTIKHLPSSTSWKQSVNAIKQLRDALDHPKFDGYNVSPLSIIGDCAGALQYAQFLVEKSPRIQKIFQSRHSELKQLIVEALGTLKSIDVREGETFRQLDFGDQPDQINTAVLKSMPDDGSIALVSRFGIPEGMKIL